MPNEKIYVVDDEDILRISLVDELCEAGYAASGFGNPQDALEAIKKQPPVIVITDLMMPGMNGIELLRQIREHAPFVKAMVMTAFGSVDTAVEAMKLGASDYITKPFQTDEVLVRVEKLVQLSSLEQDHQQYRQFLQHQFDFSALVSNSQAMQRVKEQIQKVARTNSTVLITGETGTGKELIANVLHYNSDRANKPLIKVSCAILARDVFESELFGHEKGAFTGAVKSRPGRFEMANKGAIYLDDVDDIPLELQVKLLRVLQEREVERVGAAHPLPVDVRVIASTKVDLKKLVEEGRFREDLYYRLNVYPIHLPPLRERREDILPLIKEFSKEFCAHCEMHLTDGAKKALLNYSWPGNIRELKNIVERLVISSGCSMCDESLLPPEMIGDKAGPHAVGDASLDEILMQTEIKLLSQALERCDGNQKEAAALLRIPASTFRTKIAKYGLNK